MTAIVRILIQVAVSLALLALLLTQLDTDVIIHEMMAISPTVPLAVVPALAAVLIVSQATRWRTILAALDVVAPSAPLVRVVSLTFFANQLVPSVGGDLLRVWLGRRLSVELRTLVASVLLDRAAGFATILAICIAVLPLFHAAEGGGVFWSVLLTIAAGVSALAALLGLHYLPRAVLRLRFAGEVAHVSTAAWQVVRRGNHLAGVVALSLVSHGALMVTAALLASASGVALGMLDYLAVLPAVLLVSMVPITIGGWGLREGAMVVGLGLVGVPAETALVTSILFGGVMAGVGVLGGAGWLLSSRTGRLAAQPD